MIIIRNISIRVGVCACCGYEWTMRKPLPTVCPKCNNPNWNKDY